MKYSHLFRFLAFLGTCTGLNAQITVTNAGFPVLNDTVFYAFDTNSNPVHMLTPPGGNQAWNLSGLQVNQTGLTVYRNPNMGAQSANFPGAELLVIEGGSEKYYNVTGTEVELMGYFGTDPIGLGINLLVPYAPPVGERRAPLNFFDINAESSVILVGIDDSEMPANLLQLFPAQADSFRIRISISRIDVVDAWGNLSIPGGCYDVLRERRTTYTERRLEAKIPPLGWLDVTDIGSQSLGLESLGVDTTKKIHFFSLLDKQEIAVLQLNNDQNAIVSVRFKHPDNSQFSISNITTSPESCPNANNGSITITTAGGTGTLTYAISGPLTQSNSTGIFTSLPDGAYNIIVTSNNSPCFQNATINVASGTDIVPPTANCVNAALNFNGQQSIVLNSNELVNATDNCGVQSITLLPNEIFASQVGQTIPVMVTVTDISSNMTSCTSLISLSGLPPGWNQEPDGIGCTNCTSEFDFNFGTGIWTGSSSGFYYGPQYTSDAIALASRTLCGNGSFTAEVTGINGTSLGWAGIVMRESNAPGAKKAQIMTNLSNFLRREVRTITNGPAVPQQFQGFNRNWLRLVRTGNQIIAYSSSNGINWFQALTAIVPMNTCIEMGLVVTNYNSTSTVTATFANVTYTGNGPAPTSHIPGIGIVYSNEQFQANFSVFPNPSSGELNINLQEYIGKNVQIELYSLEGKLMQLIQLDEILQNTHTILMDRYANGMYFVKLKSAGLPDVTKRVVLTKG